MAASEMMPGVPGTHAVGRRLSENLRSRWLGQGRIKESPLAMFFQFVLRSRGFREGEREGVGGVTQFGVLT